MVRGTSLSIPSSAKPSEYGLLPVSSGSLSSEARCFRPIRLIQAVALSVLCFGTLALTRSKTATTTLHRPPISHKVPMDVESKSEMWGWHELMGWRENRSALNDLGEFGDERYRLGFDNTARGKEEYYASLSKFAAALPQSQSLLASLKAHLPPFLGPVYPSSTDPAFGSPSMISYKIIHQTDKENEHQQSTQDWITMNEIDGWRLNFMDDEAANKWIEQEFAHTDVRWAWEYMHRGVLKADFLRYLLPLIQGGVYSDVDTKPLRPIEQWGTIGVEYLDISNTDGSEWEGSLATFPSVVVAIDIDVHKHPSWYPEWPRPLGICQWTLSSAPYHPIFIDAARRVVNATRVVEAWEDWRSGAITDLESNKPEGWNDDINRLHALDRREAMTVLEWTGPGLFTDSVMAYLQARYDVTWHRLRGLDHPLRIGDVMILPITAFSPGGEPDFHAEGRDSVQANVLHNFRGSWKTEGS